MEEADKGWLRIRIGVSAWMFLLVPAHPGSPRQEAVNQMFCCFCCLQNKTGCITNGVRTIGSHTILGYLGVWWYFWGYLVTCSAKYDVIFLLKDPDSYKGDEISHLSHLVLKIWRGTDRWQMRRLKQKALCKCASLTSSIISDGSQWHNYYDITILMYGILAIEHEVTVADVQMKTVWIQRNFASTER